LIYYCKPHFLLKMKLVLKMMLVNHLTNMVAMLPNRDNESHNPRNNPRNSNIQGSHMQHRVLGGVASENMQKPMDDLQKSFQDRSTNNSTVT
jgi:hypothetical protein